MAVNISRRQLLLALPLAGTGLALSTLSSRAQTTGLQSIPYVSGTEGYTCFRTPSLAITKSGSVLAFGGGRVENCRDDGDHDVVLRRSLDGGRTWQPLQVLANDGLKRCDIPMPVRLPTGRILLLWVRNTFVTRKEDRHERRLMVMHSDDDGLTWSTPRDVTSQVMLPSWKLWFGIGPGHAFVKQLAPAAGRIIVPARHGQDDRGSRSHILYSDDSGLTWHVGAQAMGPEMTNEATACELGDGSIMLNSRSNLGYRVVTICGEGGRVALRSFVDRGLIEPRNGCQASILTYSIDTASKKATLLFSNPQNQQYRTNGRIRLSRDNGKTWTRGFLYQQAVGSFTGYSDLARFENGDVALLFESGSSYQKGIFVDPVDGSVTFTNVRGNRRRHNQKGRFDNRHDGMTFRRIPFNLIAASP